MYIYSNLICKSLFFPSADSVREIMQPSCQKIWTPCSNPIVVEKQQAAYSQDGSDFLLSLGLSEYIV